MQRCSRAAAAASRLCGAALVAWSLPGRTAPQLLRSFHGDSTHSEGLYEALGVERTASKRQIKHAFRQKAKQHHPDRRQQASESPGGGPDASAAAFAQILTAYQVLTSDRQRELYNLQLDSQGIGRHMRGGSPAYDREAAEESMEWAWGLRGLTRVADNGPTHTALDRLRGELRGELRSALLVALDTAAGQLPGEFEMEERSTAAASDEVLQLVSGRQLLGAVRLRRNGVLPRQAQPPQPLPGDSNRALPATPEHASPRRQRSQAVSRSGGPLADASAVRDGAVSSESSSGSVQSGASVRYSDLRAVQAISRIDRGADHNEGLNRRLCGADPRSRDTSPPGWAPGIEVPSSSVSRAGSSTAAGHSPESPQQPWGTTLELIVGDEVTAVAVQRPRRNGEPLTEVYNSGGGLVAREAGGYIQRLEGGSKHSVVRGTTPLVRHLQLMYTPTGAKKPVCLARLKRAWLPPAATWLFPPRTETHAVGGWYVEWCGHSAAGNPAYLDPSVMIMLAAFDTLAREARRGQRSGSAGGGDKRGHEARHAEGAEGQGTLAWLKSMLAFHGKTL